MSNNSGIALLALVGVGLFALSQSSDAAYNPDNPSYTPPYVPPETPAIDAPTNQDGMPSSEYDTPIPVNYSPGATLTDYQVQKAIAAMLTVIRTFESGSQYDALVGNVGTVPDMNIHPWNDIVNFPPGGAYSWRAGYTRSGIWKDSGGFFNRSANSSAAGAYQFIGTTWNGLQKRLGLPDFSPDSQDKAAAQLLVDTGAVRALAVNDPVTAFTKASREWASLPASTSGQPKHSMNQTIALYNSALNQTVA